ncbi:MAG TPA: hypothetical protein VFB27_13370 [Opitutaceae bacterium]|nr:hypothetical protein [Opitutaceae bacterium]
MDLDRYGAGCRCLLRIRENGGNPPISDASFIAERQEAYPDWAERPGAADLPRLCEIAFELGVSSGGEVFCEYDRILGLHRTGHPVLISSGRTPRSIGSEGMALVVEMDGRGMDLWIPRSDGTADSAQERRENFAGDVWKVAIVLYPVHVSKEDAPMSLGTLARPSAGADLPPIGTDRWADWSAALIQEARQSIEDMSTRRWKVVHPDDGRMHTLLRQFDSGDLTDVAVEMPRMIRWHSAQDGRAYILVEFFRLSRQPVSDPAKIAMGEGGDKLVRL